MLKVGDVVTAQGRPGIWEIASIKGQWAGLQFADDRPPTLSTLGVEERKGISHIEIAVKLEDLAVAE